MNARPRHYRGVAAALLLVGGMAEFAWHHVPPALQADVWNASGAALALLLLALVANAYRTRAALWACALLAAYKAMTLGCTLAYLARPWPIAPGDGQCSAALNMPLGAVQAWLLALLAAAALRDKDNNTPNNSEGERGESG